MTKINPQQQREFAVEVVRQLRDHGFQAYWAGGCVRDSLLNRVPKDYDVATSAHPEQIRAVFRHRKTLAIGAAFGVMTVLGPRSAGQIEVATFRQDISYSDGRHPDRIAFSSPEEDARRRDFTMNGMFYDPLAEQVIDFVNGQADLSQGLIRAIGNAQARFTEDKLRMLRAVRFAAKFNFRLEPSTFAAMCEMASQITVVSAERIADEMRTILVHASRVRAIRLLQAAGLLAAILPQVEQVAQRENWPRDLSGELEPTWQPSKSHSAGTLSLLRAVEEPSFPLALAILLHSSPGNDLAETVGRSWKLSRAEIERLAWLLEHHNSFARARAPALVAIAAAADRRGRERFAQASRCARRAGFDRSPRSRVLPLATGAARRGIESRAVGDRRRFARAGYCRGTHFFAPVEIRAGSAIGRRCGRPRRRTGMDSAAVAGEERLNTSTA